MLVNIMNPDAYIARFNIEQYHRTGKVDVVYFGRLSTDAQAEKMELYTTLKGEDRKMLKEFFHNQKAKLQKNSEHWQSANFARAQAVKLLQDF
jgi:hypothetical protein